MAIDSLKHTGVPLTVTDAAAGLRAGDLTSVALTSALLARADALDPLTGTYVTRLDDYALAQAEQADSDFANGIDKGPYQGIPIGIKDILAMAEGPTTANSLILDRDWGAGKDGPVVRRLKAAGAVVTGKLTTSEFAIGSPDSSKPFAIPKNPWDLDRSPGGSSAGTGNGVAAGLILAGIGTDTGGSIRIPAAWNGVSGLMPTFGRVPKSGCVPLGYSLDHIGPLARSARDCAAMLDIIAGYHPSDESCADRPVDDYLGALTGDLTGVRIGVELTNHFPEEESDPALRPCFDAAVAALADLGADIVEVTLPLYTEVTTALWLMMTAEALAYHHNDLGGRWEDYYALTRANVSRGALASGADYVQAARVRRVAQQKLAEVFERVDLVVAPTAAAGALSHQEMLGRGIARIFKTVFTGYWDAVGNPALVVPMGFTGDGLPLSLQVGARPFEEGLALRAGDAFQTRTDWHLRLPPILTDSLADSP